MRIKKYLVLLFFYLISTQLNQIYSQSLEQKFEVIKKFENKDYDFIVDNESQVFSYGNRVFVPAIKKRSLLTSNYNEIIVGVIQFKDYLDVESFKLYYVFGDGPNDEIFTNFIRAYYDDDLLPSNVGLAVEVSLDGIPSHAVYYDNEGLSIADLNLGSSRSSVSCECFCNDLSNLVEVHTNGECVWCYCDDSDSDGGGDDGGGSGWGEGIDPTDFWSGGDNLDASGEFDDPPGGGGGSSGGDTNNDDDDKEDGEWPKLCCLDGVVKLNPTENDLDLPEFVLTEYIVEYTVCTEKKSANTFPEVKRPMTVNYAPSVIATLGLPDLSIQAQYIGNGVVDIVITLTLTNATPFLDAAVIMTKKVTRQLDPECY